MRTRGQTAQGNGVVMYCQIWCGDLCRVQPNLGTLYPHHLSDTVDDAMAYLRQYPRRKVGLNVRDKEAQKVMFDRLRFACVAQGLIETERVTA